MRNTISAFTIVMVCILCSAFTQKNGKDLNKKIIGQWGFAKATVTIQPQDEELQIKLTEAIGKLYEPHIFEFLGEDNYLYHTEEGTTKGKYLIIKNKIVFNEKSVDYNVDRFISESSDIAIKKHNKMSITSLQSEESVKEVNLIYGSDLKSIQVHVNYLKFAPKKRK